MLLAVDIGNTNINLGLFAAETLVKRYTIPTQARSYFPYLEKILAQHKIEAAVICSVVPQATQALAKGLKKVVALRIYNIGKDIEVPLKNLYCRPKQVGQDRLVNAYAGVTLYGSPLIVVDFGTAVTFDIISRKKAYLGGMILPGLNISLDALYQRTALLPKIKLTRPREFIGRDTQNSMLSGIVYGFSSLTDALVVKIKKKIGKEALVIGTGGNIRLMARYAQRLDKIDPDLTLKGLHLIYKTRQF
ncbi:MAG: type III pantothenate kinase [Candidatus Omnitrophica bacterium]|nr:type III pantothenate kinase [Candidatus Omnitrophota bacterium]